MEEKKHEDNVYAANIENDVIHISEAESGRKGYYCLGCKGIMQAKRSQKRKEHFAHDPQNKKSNIPCTYSDESYRHKLAKEILQIIKKIKVPAVYKYPPKGFEGRANKLQDAKFIIADEVSIELIFFEDEDGLIHNGKNINTEPGSNKYLLIRPDVTFFDSNENPILFIEIVATHKVDVDKITKLKQIGIDTVQVTIPKESPEAIQNTFFYTERTKWIYNNEYEKATYIPTSQRNGEGIPSSEDLQRKLFETAESYECRAAQINNLIRGLNKSLGSQQYADFKRYIGEEIQRVEDNTERHRERLCDLQEGHERSSKEEFRLQMEDVARQETAISEESKALDGERRDLEERYYRKKGELEGLQKNYRSEFEPEIRQIESEFERLGTDVVNFRNRSEEIRRDEDRFRAQYSSKIRSIKDDEGQEAEVIRDLETRRDGLPNKYLEEETRIRDVFERKANEIERDFEERIRSAREESERLRRELTEAIAGRDSSRVSDSRLERRIRSILETRKRLSTLSKRKVDLARLRKFRELFETGAYKSWT